MKTSSVIFLFLVGTTNLYGMQDDTFQLYENAFTQRLGVIIKELKEGPDSISKLHTAMHKACLDFQQEPARQWHFVELFRQQFDSLIASLEFPIAQAMLNFECVYIMRRIYQNVLIRESKEQSDVVLDLSYPEQTHIFALTQEEESKIVRSNCAALVCFYADRALASSTLSEHKVFLLKEKKMDAQHEVDRFGQVKKAISVKQILQRQNNNS